MGKSGSAAGRRKPSEPWSFKRVRSRPSGTLDILVRAIVPTVAKARWSRWRRNLEVEGVGLAGVLFARGRACN
jgi:hypothetical protein